MAETERIFPNAERDKNVITESISSTSPETLISDDESTHTGIPDIEGLKIEQLSSEMPHKEIFESSVQQGKSEILCMRGKSSSLSAGEIEDIAQKLYDEKFVSISPEEYTQFLAAHDGDSSAIRDRYMDLFEWDISLIKSTRKLCTKLFLKGESQEIDRLLSAFTKSYLRQHPDNVFCTHDFEQIYIVLYSLILLNTSLHNSGVNKKSKLSQADYIRNTLTTFLSQNKKAARELTVKQKIQIERELNAYYEDLTGQELYLKKNNLPITLQRDVENSNRFSIADTIYSSVSGANIEIATVSPLANKSAELVKLSRQESGASIVSSEAEGKRRTRIAMKRMTSMASTASSNSTASTFSAAPTEGNGHNLRFGFTRALLSESKHRASNTSSLRNRQSSEHLRNLARRSSRSSISTKDSAIIDTETADDAFSIITFDDMPKLELLNSCDQKLYKLEHFDVANFQDPLDLKLELQGAPYLKEGLLKLRIQNNDMADNSSSGDSNASSANSTHSISSSRSGFFSFFSRSSNKEASAPALGTSGNNVFSNKFTEYFVVVSKGELRLYSFDPKVMKKQQEKTRKLNQNNALHKYELIEEDKDLGDGNWLRNAAHIGNYNLCSTIAQLEKSNIVRSSSSSSGTRVIFSLSFPQISKRTPKKFLFEAGTVDVANEFVNTCNFWASKLTAVPTLEESVSSIEYGWTNLDALFNLGENFKKTKSISKWESIPKGVYLSSLSSIHFDEGSEHEGILKQFAQTLKYYNNLKGLYNSFNLQKTQFIKYFRIYWNTSNYKLIMQNYDARSEEYKFELKKYKSYITMLGYGLKLRFDFQHEDQMITWAEEILKDPDNVSPEALALELSRRNEEAEANETPLTKAVKLELERLIQISTSMRKLIAQDKCHDEYETKELETKNKLLGASHNSQGDSTNPSLVKSPKTFSLANFDEEEGSPIIQLLSADRNAVPGEHEGGIDRAKKELIMSYSTNTITEEEEPED